MPMTEIDLMLRAGMTPMQIIVALPRTGHTSAAEDLQALTDVQIVVHNGVVIRSELPELKAAVATSP